MGCPVEDQIERYQQQVEDRGGAPRARSRAVECASQVFAHVDGERADDGAIDRDVADESLDSRSI
jgi:hypothetical protein